MDNFIYDGLPTRVIFGVGTLDSLPAEVSRLGPQALFLCTPPQRHDAEEAAQKLGALAVGIYDQAVMHVPAETALQEYRNGGIGVLQSGKVDEDEHYYLDTESIFGFVYEIGSHGKIRSPDRRLG
jgi:hypothetical protein